MEPPRPGSSPQECVAGRGWGASRKVNQQRARIGVSLGKGGVQEGFLEEVASELSLV